MGVINQAGQLEGGGGHFFRNFQNELHVEDERRCQQPHITIRIKSSPNQRDAAEMVETLGSCRGIPTRTIIPRPSSKNVSRDGLIHLRSQAFQHLHVDHDLPPCI